MSANKLLRDLSELYFVEENSINGFCSEACIEKFYKGLVEYFEAYQQGFEELGLVLSSVDDEPQILEEVLKKPYKILQWSNQTNTKITHFLGKVNDTYVVVTCFLYEGSASFILGLTYHSDKRIFDYFEKGEEKKILFESKEQSSGLSNDQLEYIEHKGELLAKVLKVILILTLVLRLILYMKNMFLMYLENPDFKKRHDSSGLGDVYLYSKIIFEDNRKVFLVLANLESRVNPWSDPFCSKYF